MTVITGRVIDISYDGDVSIVWILDDGNISYAVPCEPMMLSAIIKDHQGLLGHTVEYNDLGHSIILVDGIPI
jgi:hypothetical protein